MRSLDTPEIHGYSAAVGYRVYTTKVLEIATDNHAGSGLDETGSPQAAQTTH